MAIDFPISPNDAVKILLQSLPAKRMRDVLERRFGLKGGKKATLEEIGGAYKITRERVRQIEADAMRRLRERDHEEVRPLLISLESVVREHGDVMADHHLMSYSASPRIHPHLQFLLHTHPGFSYIAETEAFHPRWTGDRAVAEEAEKTMTRVAKRLEESGIPVAEDRLHAFLTAEAGAGGKEALSEKVRHAYLQSAKLIKRNPYGEYGLVSWPTVCPRGIKDKAYAALFKAGRPMHFRDVASAIDRAGWSGKKKAHPQTVHNELIKDPRFILVGRGIYALKDWGYESGTVRDILVSLLTNSPHPLTRDELVRQAGERRMVKAQTILLNLQDRTYFKRTEDGGYTLV